MKLGFVNAILPDQTLEEVVQFAAEIGYDCKGSVCVKVEDHEFTAMKVTYQNNSSVCVKVEDHGL